MIIVEIKERITIVDHTKTNITSASLQSPGFPFKPCEGKCEAVDVLIPF